MAVIDEFGYYVTLMDKKFIIPKTLIFVIISVKCGDGDHYPISIQALCIGLNQYGIMYSNSF